MNFLRVLLSLPALTLTAVHAAERSHEESVFLFENRKVVLAVPEGCGFASDKDEEGTLAVEIADKKQHVHAHLIFAPDPERRYAAVRERREKMVELFRDAVEASVEKVMNFRELEPAAGAGTFCVLTDAKLAGENKPPAGQFSHSVSGLKAWPGVVVVFRVLTNDLSGKEYKAVMAMLRESVQENNPKP